MTAAARITQADIERILKAVRNAGWPSARLVCNYANGTVEVFLSQPIPDPPVRANPWDAEFEDDGDAEDQP